MKRLFALLISALLVLTLISCGGGGGGSVNNNTGKENLDEKITLLQYTEEDYDSMISVDFFYPSDADITIENDEYDLSWANLYYEDTGVRIGPALFEDTTFDENKEYAQEEEETYTEFEIDGYDCYAYEDFGGYWIYVHLEELSENVDRYLIITLDPIDFDDPVAEGEELYEDEDVKAIVESFVYNGLVESEDGLDDEWYYEDYEEDYEEDEAYGDGIDTSLIVGDWDVVGSQLNEAFFFFDDYTALYVIDDQEQQFEYYLTDDGFISFVFETGNEFYYTVTFDGSDTVILEDDFGNEFELERI